MPERELTPRKVEVLRLMAEGLTDAQIGKRMGITAHAVKGHLGRIRVILGAVNRAHAVTLGFRKGYLR